MARYAYHRYVSQDANEILYASRDAYNISYTSRDAYDIYTCQDIYTIESRYHMNTSWDMCEILYSSRDTYIYSFIRILIIGRIILQRKYW